MKICILEFSILKVSLEKVSSLKVSLKPSPNEQKHLQDQSNHIIEGKAEKKYRELDSKYDSKLKGQEKKAQKLVEKIDYTITAYKVAFAKCPETDKTLLLIDWEDLRNKFSIKDIMKFEEHAFYKVNIVAFFEAILNHFNQSK